MEHVGRDPDSMNGRDDPLLQVLADAHRRQPRERPQQLTLRMAVARYMAHPCLFFSTANKMGASGELIS